MTYTLKNTHLIFLISYHAYGSVWLCIENKNVAYTYSFQRILAGGQATQHRINLNFLGFLED